MALAPAQIRALLVSSVLCLAVGVGGGMLAMGALGYHWEPRPTNLAGGGPGQPGKFPGEMTWLTAAGTKGNETVITIELTPRQDGGTELTLTHAGFRTTSREKVTKRPGRPVSNS